MQRVPGARRTRPHLRRHLPLRRRYSSASFEAVLQAALPQNRKHSLDDLDDNLLAKSPARPMETRVKAWQRMCEAWDQPASNARVGLGCTHSAPSTPWKGTSHASEEGNQRLTLPSARTQQEQSRPSKQWPPPSGRLSKRRESQCTPWMPTANRWTGLGGTSRAQFLATSAGTDGRALQRTADGLPSAQYVPTPHPAGGQGGSGGTNSVHTPH